MAMTPSPAAAVPVRDGPYYLSAFDKPMAPIVASWVGDERELLWLAPKTPPYRFNACRENQMAYEDNVAVTGVRKVAGQIETARKRAGPRAVWRKRRADTLGEDTK